MIYDNANIYIYVEKYTYKRNTKCTTQYLYVECYKFSFLYLYFDLYFDFLTH